MEYSEEYSKAMASVHPLLRDSHRLFIQTMMSNGCLGSRYVKIAWKRSCTRFSENCSNDKEMVQFIQIINMALRELQLEIRKSVDENNGEHFYVLVNKADSNVTRLASDFSATELELFKKLVEEIVLSGTGRLSSVEALNLVDKLSKKLSRNDAEEFYIKLVRAKWLGKTDNGKYYLSARSIAELEKYITDQYPNEVSNCNVCQKLCIQGQKCRMCDTILHFVCAQKLFKDNDSRCPNTRCKAPWKHLQHQALIGSQEISQEEPDRNMDEDSEPAPTTTSSRRRKQ